MANSDVDADGPVLREGSSLSLYVTAIELSLGACRFWAQCNLPSKSLSQLESLMSSSQNFIETAPKIVDTSRLEAGDLCFAKFSEDGVWYRAVVWCVKSRNEYTVFFIDYGNVDTVPTCDLRLVENVKLAGPTLTSSAQDILFGIPAQATECILANVMPVEPWKWSEEAAKFLTETLLFQEFVGVVNKSTKKKALIEIERTSGELLAHELIKAGFGKSCDNSYTLQDAYSHMTFPVDYEDDVCIACCISPEQFWVHLKSSPVEEVTDKVTEFYNSVPDSELKLSYIMKGTPCVAKYVEDGGYYRAKVTEVLGDDKYRVQFIDFGNSDVVSPENIRATHFSLFQSPVYAIECALEGVRSLHKEAAQRFIQLTVDQTVRAIIEGQNQNKLFVSMYNFSDGIPMSIADALFKEGLILFSEGDRPPCRQVHLEDQKLKLWSFHSVYITHVENPSNFSCQLASCTAEIDSIMDELAKSCTESKEVTLKPADLVSGFVCSAQFTEDNLWYRAQIIKLVDDGKAEVKYIDFGNSETIPITRLQYLPANCCQPIQEIQCSLAYVKPTEKEWSKQETEWLQELAFDKSLIAYVLAIDKYGRYSIELARAADAQNSINTMIMVNQQMQNPATPATSENKSSRIPTEPLEDKHVKLANHTDIGGSGDMKAAFNHMDKESPLVLSKPDVESGSKLAVVITSVESVSNFHCQLGGHKIDQLQDTIQKFYTSHSGKLGQPPLKPNVTCCAQFTEDNEWYRANILEIDEEKGNAKVMYVDYGNTENISVFRLKQLLREFYDEPVQCVPCCLPENTCRILGSNQKQVVSETFEELVAGKEIRAVVVGKTQDGKLVVELIDQHSGVDYGQKLMEAFGVGKQRTPIKAEIEKKSRQAQDSRPPSSETVKRKLSGMQKDVEYTKAKLKDGSSEEIMVTHYIDPEHFWCQLLCSEAKLNSLMEDVDAYCSASKPFGGKQPWGLGIPCLAQYTENCQWYRAVVTGIKHNGDVEVQYVDYGNEEILSPSKVMEIPEKFTALPIQAVHCSLVGVVANGSEWTEQQVAKLREMIENQVFTAKIRGVDEIGEVYSVELTDNQSNNVNEKFGEMTKTLVRKPTNKPTNRKVQSQVNGLDSDFRFSKKSVSNTHHAAFNTNQNNSSTETRLAEPSRQFKNKKLAVDERYDVFVSYIDNPHQFVCQLVGESNQLDELMNDIAAFYSKSVSAELALKSIQVGLPCCAQFTEDDGWYRAKVVDVSGEHVTVKYVDYGNSETLPVHRVKALKPKFMDLAAQAIECTLHNVKPVSDPWTPDSVACFQEVTGEKKLVANVTGVDKNGKVTVDLIDTDSAGGVSIKDELVTLKHAATCDVSESSEESQDNSKTKGRTSSMVAPAMTSTPFDGSKSTPLSVTGKSERAETIQQHKEVPIQPQISSKSVSMEMYRLTESVYQTKQNIEVTVSHVNSPVEFWCQPAELSDEFYQLLDEMKVYYDVLEDRDRALKDYTLGSQCVAQYCVDSSWYRATVIGRTPTNLKVLFVDYGNTESVPVNKVKEMEEKFMKLPIQAFQCCLDGFTATDGRDELLQLVDGQVLACTIVNSHPTGMYEVNLMKNDKNISDQLKTVMASKVNEDNKDKSVAPSIGQHRQQTNKSSARVTDDVEIGGFEDLLVSHVQSASRLWCNLAKYCSEVDQLLTEMTNFYEDGGSKFTHSILAGQRCAAKYVDGSWYRATVREVKEDEISVFFTDFGNEEKISVSDVKVLEEKFSRLPEQAVECQLHGVTDKKGSALTAVCDMTADKQLVGRVLEKTPPKLIIELFDTSGEMDININEEMKKFEAKDDTVDMPTKISETVPEETKASLASYPSQCVEVGSVMEGYISHINSVQQFFVQFASDEEKLTALEAEIQGCVDKFEEMRDTVIGMPCLARYSANQVWCRARVENISGEQATVLFVDYGNSEVQSVSEIKVLKADLCRQPPFAIECILDGMDSTKSADVDDYFMKLTLDKNLQISFVTAGQPCKVKLQSENEDISGLIKKKFQIQDQPETVSSAQMKDVTDAIENLKVKESTSMVDKYSKFDMKVGESFVVYVSSVDSPWKFWCQLTTTSSKLTDLDAKIQAYCSSKEDKPIQAVTVSMPCLAFFTEDQRWYRSRIIDIGVSSCTVLFVDYGNSEECEVSNLRGIPQEFLQLEEQSFQCHLCGIDDLPQCWSHENEVKFEETILDVELTAKITDVDGEKCGVELYNEGNSVIDILVSEGLVGLKEKSDDDEKEEEPKKESKIQMYEKEDEENDREKTEQAGDFVRAETHDDKIPFEHKVEKNTEKPGLGVDSSVYSSGLEECESAEEGQTPVNLYTIAEMEVGAREEVSVSVVSSVSKVYCHVRALLPKLESLTQSLQEDYSQITEKEMQLDSSEIGTACAVQYDKDGQWYRAIICGCIDPHYLEVFFVDYGSIHIVPQHGIRKLKKQYFEMPALAVKCYIKEVIEAGLLSTNEALSNLEQLVYNKLMTVYVVDRVFSGVYLVQLYDGDTSVGQTMLEILEPDKKSVAAADLESHIVEYVQSPAAKSQVGKSPFQERARHDQISDNTTSDIEQDSKDDATTVETVEEGDPKAPVKFPNLDDAIETDSHSETPMAETKFQQVTLTVGFSIQVYFLSQTSPDLFMCQFADSADKLDNLHREICEHCASDNAQSITSPVVGQPCLVQYSKDCEWYRAVITAAYGPQYDVYFVDYGNSESVSSSFIRAIPPTLTELPVQCIKCRLANVKGIDENWSDEAVTWFEEWCSDKLLTAEIMDVGPDEVIDVKLCSDDGTDVSQAMVAAKHATLKPRALDDAEESDKVSKDEFVLLVDGDVCKEVSTEDIAEIEDMKESVEEDHRGVDNTEPMEISVQSCDKSMADFTGSDVWRTSDDNLLDTTQETKDGTDTWHGSCQDDANNQKSAQVIDITTEQKGDVQASDGQVEPPPLVMVIPQIQITQYDSNCDSIDSSNISEDNTLDGKVEVASDEKLQTELHEKPDASSAAPSTDDGASEEIRQVMSHDDRGRKEVYSVTDDILMDLISNLHLRGEPDFETSHDETNSTDSTEANEDHSCTICEKITECEEKRKFSGTEVFGWTEGTTSDISALSSVELARDAALTSAEQTEIEVSTQEDLETTWQEGDVPNEEDFVSQLDTPTPGSPIKDTEFLVSEGSVTVPDVDEMLGDDHPPCEPGNSNDENISESPQSPTSLTSEEFDVWYDVTDSEQLVANTDKQVKSIDPSAQCIDTKDIPDTIESVDEDSQSVGQTEVNTETVELPQSTVNGNLSADSGVANETLNEQTAPPHCLPSDSVDGASSPAKENLEENRESEVERDESEDLIHDEIVLIRGYIEEIIVQAVADVEVGSQFTEGMLASDIGVDRDVLINRSESEFGSSDDSEDSNVKYPDLCIIGKHIEPVPADSVSETVSECVLASDATDDNLETSEKTVESSPQSRESERVYRIDKAQIDEVCHSKQENQKAFTGWKLEPITEKEEECTETSKSYPLPRKSTVSSDDWVDINTEDMEESFTEDGDMEDKDEDDAIEP
ncbi:uncharacterized protein [Ptychodera flava]|uniref:uncharacterized protein n=1 Tax=Ptychodera flava TaxID=63121 RepID=UPI00396A829C